MKDRDLLIAELPKLLPLAAEWAAEEEQRVLREGVPLTAPQMDDARAVGVREPERVRLLRVEEIPFPKDPLLRAAAKTVHFLSPETSALALQYGILIRWDCWDNRHILAHELAHTAQYERLGGILPRPLETNNRERVLLAQILRQPFRPRERAADVGLRPAPRQF